MNCKYVGLVIGRYDSDFLFEHVLNNNPDVKKENIKAMTAINDHDLVILYNNGKREVFDTFENTRQYVIYHTDAMTEEDHRKQFPDLLRKWMRRKFMNQSDLSKKIGTSQQMVSKYLTGTAIPGFGRLKKIADVLGCSVEDLYLNYPWSWW
jgi:DNA-binding Xre family transcriptional regulator